MTSPDLHRTILLRGATQHDSWRHTASEIAAVILGLRSNKLAASSAAAESLQSFTGRGGLHTFSIQLQTARTTGELACPTKDRTRARQQRHGHVVKVSSIAADVR